MHIYYKGIYVVLFGYPGNALLMKLRHPKLLIGIFFYSVLICNKILKVINLCVGKMFFFKC